MTSTTVELKKNGVLLDSYHFPNLWELMTKKNVKLRLDGCKIHLSQAGRWSLVNPVYGMGYYGSWNNATGKFHPTRDCKISHIYQLQKIEEGGLDAALEVSAALGMCCCCGRTLSAEESIKAGIGPICAGKFGWGRSDPNQTTLEEI